MSLAIIGLYAVLIQVGGDVSWLGTVAIFAPRWPLLLPWGAIVACCIFWSPRILWLHLVSAILLFGPVMGLCLPSVGNPPSDPAEARFRLMTVNLGGGIDPVLFQREIDRWQPEIVVIQEGSNQLVERVLGDGWHLADASRPFIASRLPIGETETFSGKPVGRWGNVALRARITTARGSFWVNCLHLQTPRPGLEAVGVSRRGLRGIDAVRENTSQRAAEAKLVSQWLNRPLEPSIIAGDFNTPVESQIYRRYWSGYQNAFSQAGWGFGHTKFTRWYGVRIDHILATEHFTIDACRVGGFIGGDHRPVVADLIIRGPDTR